MKIIDLELENNWYIISNKNYTYCVSNYYYLIITKEGSTPAPL